MLLNNSEFGLHNGNGGNGYCNGYGNEGMGREIINIFGWEDSLFWGIGKSRWMIKLLFIILVFHRIYYLL